MKTSLAWLNTYLDRSAALDEATRTLTHLGFPTESWHQVGDDWAMEVEVTSNRGDCLSHVGQARDLAAATDRTLRPPNCTLPAAGGGAVESLTSVENHEQGLCPLYTARVIRGVKVGPSPDWLVRRLESVGLRSVNNVVDVTNFVLQEMGQPLHAFDLNLLEGRRIVVRRARGGERFTAIDGSRHELRDDMLVVADAQRPVAVAGVMGGLDSEVSATTTDILLESAIFDPLSVRQASRALKLSSDSSYRFERGIDPLGVDRASCRAAQLIVELTGGTLAEGVIRVGDGGALNPRPRTLSLRVARCDALLGFAIEPERMVDLLSRLGLEPRYDAQRDEITCTVPSFRLDLTREADLIEEVVRLHGLDHLPVRGKIEIIASRQPTEVAAMRKLRQVLVAAGYHEAITFSFVPPRVGEPFLPAGHAAVRVDDDRRKAEPMLRPSLLPSLLAVRKGNQDAGNADVRLFETASTYSKSPDGRIVETRRLALLTDADQKGDSLRQVKGVLTELAWHLLGGQATRFEPANVPHLAYGLVWQLAGDPQFALGRMGVLDAQTQERFDLQIPIVAAEVELFSLVAGYPPARKVCPLPRFPAIERDLSIVVDAAAAWADIERCVRKAGPQWLENIAFLTTYRGKPIAAGFKSVSLRLTFRDPAGTLRHELIDGQVDRVVRQLKMDHKAELRAG